MAITPQQARAELARRELARRGKAIEPAEPSLMDTVGKAASEIMAAPGQVAETLKTPRDVSQNYGDYLPAAGAVVGTAFGGLGAPIGAGVGQITRNVAGIAYGDPTAPRTAGAAAGEAIAQTALAGIPEIGGVKSAVQAAAKGLSRRALGFTKGMLKRTGTAQADEIGQAMLDKGVVRFGSGTENTLERAKELSQSTGEAIGSTIDDLAKSGQRSFTTSDVGREIETQLRPKYKGGVYDKEHAIVDEILQTIQAHGDGPLDFQSAQALKTKLQELGKFQVGGDNVRNDFYRRASGVVRNALDTSIEANLGGEATKGFLQNKRTYGQAEQAVTALSDKMAGEAANNLVSLRGAAAGGIGMATGNPLAVAEGIGAWELLRRRGEASGAALLNYVNNSGPVSAARRALISTLITKAGRQEYQ